MIQYHNRLRPIQKCRILGIAWPVGIHNNQHRIGIYQFISHLMVDEHIWIIILISQEHVQIWGNGMAVAVNQDISPFAYTSGSTKDSDRCSEGINICDLMPHNHDIIFGIDDFQESLCLNTGTDTGTFFYLLGLATIIRNGGGILYDCLIAATSKSQVNRCMGKRIILLIILSIRTDTDA